MTKGLPHVWKRPVVLVLLWRVVVAAVQAGLCRTFGRYNMLNVLNARNTSDTYFAMSFC